MLVCEACCYVGEHKGHNAELVSELATAKRSELRMFLNATEALNHHIDERTRELNDDETGG